MSSFLGINVSDAKEPVCLPDGEYVVKVHDAELVPTKKNPNVMQVVLTLSFPQHPLAKLTRDYIQLPAESDDETTQNRKLLRLKALTECFGVDRIDDVKDLTALEGTVILKTESSDDFGDQNRISKYIKA